ncbi:MAG TPA: phosphate transport system regulatory protein PhoU [Verrucomicrobiales bacterium]|nr:phosphate transport system regulatory protein PhoU [Verrucomicrobiales bacterium]
MTHHEQDLTHLKERLITMASHAETAVNRYIKALVERDNETASRAKEEDRVIDQLEVEIDDLAITLLAKAPLATDLRLITVAMKISHDLERVGDEATTIARRAVELNQEPPLKPYVDIPHMARLALEMLREALDAFVSRDPRRARAVIPRDKEVDGLNKQLHRELASYMVEKPATISRCLNLMVISKALERIADHATNIAEEVVFLYEGRDIRHLPVVKAAAP